MSAAGSAPEPTVDAARGSEPLVHLSFRFHTNFYHSYRGDSPDELGFGKDIRIIGSILDALDRLNVEGVPVRGTWDIENYFSLEKLIPAHAPDILERIRHRVAAGLDAVCPMSWNNGIVSACTPEEFDAVTEWTLRNEGRSGLSDLFPSWERVLRPQECMYTPSFLRRYPEHGIGAISLYYSALPFNGFSNFVPPLSFEQRYNPLRLRATDLPGEMVLLPAYNNGDVADHWLSLRAWLRSMRRRQMRLAKAGELRGSGDLLLLIDMDADDDFWIGMGIPVASKLFPSFDGLYRMVRSVASLPWLRFSTAGDYLERHEPLDALTIDQDTADGSFDGLSSWAEKWSNTSIWSLLQRARMLADCAARIAAPDGLAAANLQLSLRERLLTMSTTHFGLTAPVMHARRLECARERAEAALAAAQSAFDACSAALGPGSLVLPECSTGSAGRGSLVQFSSRSPLPSGIAVYSRSGEPAGRPFPLDTAASAGEFRYAFASRPSAKDRLTLRRDGAASQAPDPSIEITDTSIANGAVRIEADAAQGLRLFQNGRPLCARGYPAASVRYGGRLRRSTGLNIHVPCHPSPDTASLEIEGRIPLGAGAECSWTQRYLVAAGLPYVFVDVEMRYAKTEHRGYSPSLARKLQATWDERWNEVAPYEIIPQLGEARGAPIAVWKHNFFGDTTHFHLDYGRHSRNRELDSFNNQITNGWVAVSAGGRGMLVAQSCLSDNSFAFCPMRLRERGGRQVLHLNPFGTWHGRQWRYASAATGLGRLFALAMADHLRSYAPSYNGRTSRFTLMIAGFEGDRPDEATCADAMRFSTPAFLIDYGARGGPAVS